MVEVSSPSHLLKPGHRQASHSHSDASPASDDGSNIAKIAVLERRQDEMEKWVHDFDLRLKQLGG
jgi:hypothetical protein